jgi:serine phosphatase RsbU (regulator of sigma subunit)
MKNFFFWRRSEEATAPGEALEAKGLLTGDPREDQASMQMLLESIAEVTSRMELDEVLERIVQRSLQVTNAERAIVLLGQDKDHLEVRIARDNRGLDLGQDLQFSRTMVAKAIEDALPVKSVVRSDQEALELGQSVFDLKLRAVMCAPLIAHGRRVGVIYVDSRAQRREFSGRDLALFGALSAQISIAVENARLHEDSLAKVRLEKDVEIARKIQKHLLTTLPSGLSDFHVALFFRACDQTSGDTYDFMPLSGGRLAVAIGDATGHGIGAALLTHAFQAAMRSYLEFVDDLSEIARRLNNRLAERSEDGHFLSMAVVVIDGVAQELRYVSAGHPGMLIVREEGVQVCEKTGMVLGVVADQHYPVAGPIAFRPGDMLFLHTDGVEEAMGCDREPFGHERLHELLLAARGDPPAAVLERVHAALVAHCGRDSFEDDVTMIAIKVSD